MGEDAKNVAKQVVKRKIKKKAKDILLKVLAKVMIPWGFIFIGILIVATLVITMFQSFANGDYDIDLTKEDSQILTEYIDNKVKDANSSPTDYFGYIQGHRLKTTELTNLVSYVNTYSEESFKSSSKLLSHYKKVVNDVLKGCLLPKFTYTDGTTTTQKVYDAWIKKWDKKDDLVTYSGRKLNYKLIDYIQNTKASDYKDGDRVYAYEEGKLYKVSNKGDQWYIANGLRNTINGSILNYKLVETINKDSASNYSVGTYIYAYKDNAIYVVNSKNVSIGVGGVQQYRYFRKVSDGKPSALSNITFVKSYNELPLASSLGSGKGVYVVSQNKTYFKPVDGKAEFIYLSGKPSDLKDHSFIKNSSDLPDVSQLTVNKVFYVIKENKSYVVTEELEHRNDSITEDILLLNTAETYINFYEYYYEWETTTVTTIPDGTEDGRVEGEIEITITKPVPKGKKAKLTDYDKLKKFVLTYNKDEDIDFVVAMMKFADDKSFEWVLKDSNYSFSMSGDLMANEIPPELLEFFKQAGEASGVPPALLAAMTKHESSFNPNAVATTPNGSAHGLMQIWQPDWAYYCSLKSFQTFMNENGFNIVTPSQSWDLYLASPKMQIFAGAWEINRYINYSLNYHGLDGIPFDFNKATMSRIDWDNIEKDAQVRSYVGKGVAMYNGGPSAGWNTDLNGSGQIATYVQRVIDTMIRYSKTSNIVDIALKFLGFPYLWGGDDPSDGGMDCSGFMQYIHLQIGINITRTTYTQAEYQGFKDVSFNDLQPGDLIYLDTGDYFTGDLSHVVMYIGNNQFIESMGDPGDTSVSIANSRGHCVRIAPLNSWYKSRIIVIKRLK